MPESTLQSAAHKIGLDHFFLGLRDTEIVNAFWCRNFCPAFSSLHFVGAWFSINFTLVGTLLVSGNSLLGKRTCFYKVFLYLSWIMPFSLFTYHQHRIIQAGCASSSVWYLSTYLQEKGIPWAALDSEIGFCQPGRARGFRPLENNTRLISCQVFWVDALSTFRGKLLAWILHRNAMRYIKHRTRSIKEAIRCDACRRDVLIAPSVCRVCLVALKFSSTTEQFDFCSPPGVFLGDKV